MIIWHWVGEPKAMNYYQYLYGDKFVQDKKETYKTKKFYTVECIDSDGELKDLLNYIGKNGNGGHSFDIVVDPGDKQNERHFFWDGDGADRINAVVKTTTDDDKELVGILLTALNRIYMRTFIESQNSEEDAKNCRIAIQDISDIANDIIRGANFDDGLQDALREVKFAYMDDKDSAEKKLARIKDIVEEALK